MSARKWTGALVCAAALAWGWLAATPAGFTQSAVASDETDFQGMPPGKGREETFYACVVCHSMRLVTQQGLSRDRWDEAIDWMVEEQDMPELEPADRALIVDYLAEFYGPDRKADKQSTQ